MHWSVHQLPLVVTSQPCVTDTASIAVALSAPLNWERKRLSLTVTPADVSHFGEFPIAEKAISLLAISRHPEWIKLCNGLAIAQVTAHIYGSHGWQLLTGLEHLHPASDIDLWIPAIDAAQADRVTQCLQDFSDTSLRIDGEIIFQSGIAVAWREWKEWRQGDVNGILIKTLNSSALLQASTSKIIAQITGATSEYGTA